MQEEKLSVTSDGHFLLGETHQVYCSKKMGICYVMHLRILLMNGTSFQSPGGSVFGAVSPGQLFFDTVCAVKTHLTKLQTAQNKHGRVALGRPFDWKESSAALHTSLMTHCQILIHYK